MSNDPRHRSLKSKALQLLAQRDQSRVELKRKLLAHARKVGAVAVRSRRAVGGLGASGSGTFASAGDASSVDAASIDVEVAAPAHDDGAHAIERTAKRAAEKDAAGVDHDVADIDIEDNVVEDVEPLDAVAEVDAVLTWLEARRFLSDDRFAESRVHARQARFGNLRIRHELGQHGVKLSADAALALTASEMQRALVVCARKFPRQPSSLADRAAESRFLAARGFSPDVIGRAVRERAVAAARSDVPFEDAD